MGVFENITNAMKALMKGNLPEPVKGTRPRVIDGRSAALDVLGDYIAECTFYRKGPQATAFKVKRESFYPEWPDSVVELVFPSIGVIPGEGVRESSALTPYYEEDTMDVFGMGTVILNKGIEYVETCQLEVWASKIPERRGLMAGFDDIFNPFEDQGGLRLLMSDAFNRPACFTLKSSTLIDDAESAKDRRKAHIMVEMRFSIVQLVRYVTMRPIVSVDVAAPGHAFEDGSTSVEVEINP